MWFPGSTWAARISTTTARSRSPTSERNRISSRPATPSNPGRAATVERVWVSASGSAGLTAGNAYGLFDVVIQKAALGSLCTGCATPVVLRFVSLTLRQDPACGQPPVNPTVHMDGPAHNNLVTAQ